MLKEEWFMARGIVTTKRTLLRDQIKLAEENHEPRQDGRLAVPKELVEAVLEEHHSSPLAGHPGHEKTQWAVMRNYWWPTLSKDVRNTVQDLVFTLDCGIISPDK